MYQVLPYNYYCLLLIVTCAMKENEKYLHISIPSLFLPLHQMSKLLPLPTYLPHVSYHGEFGFCKPHPQVFMVQNRKNGTSLHYRFRNVLHDFLMWGLLCTVY